MKKLAIIVPYIKEFSDDFLNHFRENVDESNFEYTIIFIKQKSNRPLNKGKLFNIGYLLNKDKFDYFCFHDTEIIPLTGECDYNYTENPLSLVNMLVKVRFGEHENLDTKEYSRYSLPYDEYFGGAVIFSKESFEKINGFSNDYWGSGYEDYDLLARCIIKEMDMNIEQSKIEMKTIASFDGDKSFVQIDSDSVKMDGVLDGDFTLSSFINVGETPPATPKQSTDRCQYVIFGKPGYHSGLSYRYDNFVQATLWINSSETGKRELVVVEYPLEPNSWNHICMVNSIRKSVNNSKSSLKLYVNGRLVKDVDYSGSIISYYKKPFYIGVGDPNINSWKNYFKGMIGDVGLWNVSLNEFSVKELFSEGIVNFNNQSSIPNPVGFWNFEGGYGNKVFDVSGNCHNGTMYNIKFSSDIIKNSTTKYLPIRRNGGYGYIGSEYNYNSLGKNSSSRDPEIMKNRNTFHKKIDNSMEDMIKDGISSTKFRIVKKGNYSNIIYGSNPNETKDQLIEVII